LAGATATGFGDGKPPEGTTKAAPGDAIIVGGAVFGLAEGDGEAAAAALAGAGGLGGGRVGAGRDGAGSENLAGVTAATLAAGVAAAVGETADFWAAKTAAGVVGLATAAVGVAGLGG
jgi:hypothetical protein